MTELLKIAFAAATSLPEVEQDALAQWLLEELAAERRWTQAFAAPANLPVQRGGSPPPAEGARFIAPDPLGAMNRAPSAQPRLATNLRRRVLANLADEALAEQPRWP